MRPFAKTLLWAFTILMGLDLGAGLYEARVNVAGWSTAIVDRTPDGDAYMRFAPRAGDRWWMFLTPLLAIVTIATLIAGLRTSGAARRWIIGSAALELLVVVSTFAWFVPNIIQLMSHFRDLPPDAVASKARAWVSLNWVRAVLTMAAWLGALKAMTLSEQAAMSRPA